MKPCKRLVCVLGLCALALGAAAPAAAQGYPKGVVTIVVGAPPGGPTDFVGRIVAQQLQESWGQTVLVENKPGAGGMIASGEAARAPKDGYTASMLATGHTVSAAMLKTYPNRCIVVRSEGNAAGAAAGSVAHASMQRGWPWRLTATFR